MLCHDKLHSGHRFTTEAPASLPHRPPRNNIHSQLLQSAAACDRRVSHSDFIPISMSFARSMLTAVCYEHTWFELKWQPLSFDRPASHSLQSSIRNVRATLASIAVQQCESSYWHRPRTVSSSNSPSFANRCVFLQRRLADNEWPLLVCSDTTPGVRCRMHARIVRITRSCMWGWGYGVEFSILKRCSGYCTIVIYLFVLSIRFCSSTETWIALFILFNCI